MDPIIRLKNVSKRFGAEVALDDVSLEVPSGVVFALLGENGAGKTTAIRIMLGLADANSGQAEVLGLPSAAQGLEIRHRVGYVPERPTLYEWMTVDEIGWFTAGFYGERLPARVRPLDGRIRSAGQEKDLATLERHAGQGVAVAGLGQSAGVADSRRADLRPRRPGAPRVPGKHGRSGRGRTNRLPVEPSDRRGGTRGRHRGHPPQGQTDFGRTARRTEIANPQADRHHERRRNGPAPTPRRDSQPSPETAAVATHRPGPKRRTTVRAKGSRKRPGGGSPFHELGRNLRGLHATGKRHGSANLPPRRIP